MITIEHANKTNECHDKNKQSFQEKNKQNNNKRLQKKMTKWLTRRQ